MAPHVEDIGMRGAGMETHTLRLIAYGIMTIRLPRTSVRFQARSTSLSGTDLTSSAFGCSVRRCK